jgi:hypothetical protein
MGKKLQYIKGVYHMNISNISSISESPMSPKTQSQSKKCQKQIHNLAEESRASPYHIHIMDLIPQGSNLLPKLSEYKYVRQ